MFSLLLHLYPLPLRQPVGPRLKNSELIEAASKQLCLSTTTLSAPHREGGCHGTDLHTDPQSQQQGLTGWGWLFPASQCHGWCREGLCGGSRDAILLSSGHC